MALERNSLATCLSPTAFVAKPHSPSHCIQRFRLGLHHRNRCTTANSRFLFALCVKPAKDDDGGDNFDVDVARKQLETLMFGSETDVPSNKLGESTGKTVDALSNDYSVIETLLPTISRDEDKERKLIFDSDEKGVTCNFELPSPPPLSTIERDRRIVEIQLLEALNDGDDATQRLWELWYSERGKSAKSQLEQADQLMADPSAHRECESILQGLVNKHGVYFVEPLNRLATLWYIQGRFEDSYKLCRIVLQIKPWHIGCLAGIVQVCIALRDRSGARKWAEKRLPNCAASTSFPPFDTDGSVNNPRRTEWVENSVQEARQRLQQIEKATKRGLGKPENYYFDPPSSSMKEQGDNINRIDMVDDDDAWN